MPTPKPIKKEDIKKAVIEALEPFAGAVKKDFNRIDDRFKKVDGKFEKIDNKFKKVDDRFDKVDGRFEQIETTLIAIVEDLKEAREERRRLEARIIETHNGVDGFIKVVDRLETEFTVIKEELRKVKEVIKEKLGVDLT